MQSVHGCQAFDAGNALGAVLGRLCWLAALIRRHNLPPLIWIWILPWPRINRSPHASGAARNRAVFSNVLNCSGAYAILSGSRGKRLSPEAVSQLAEGLSAHMLTTGSLSRFPSPLTSHCS